MNPAEFKSLPALLHRSTLLALGLSAQSIDAQRQEITTAQDTVPFGRIGALRGFGRASRRKGRGYYLYRKMDVAPLLGPKYTS